MSLPPLVGPPRGVIPTVPPGPWHGDPSTTGRESPRVRNSCRASARQHSIVAGLNRPYRSHSIHISSRQETACIEWRRLLLICCRTFCGRWPVALACPRVGLPRCLFEPAYGEVRVDLGGREACMPEQLLDAPEIGASCQKLRRVAVAQGVRGHVRADA